MIYKPERLDSVHPDLADVVRMVADKLPFDIIILEGIRSRERQQQLLKSGASKTMNSRHFPGKQGFACAVDIAPMLDTDGDGDKEPSWHWTQFHAIAPIMKACAKILETPIEWGGDWSSFPDGPHWQLPWAEYP